MNIFMPLLPPNLKNSRATQSNYANSTAYYSITTTIPVYNKTSLPACPATPMLIYLKLLLEGHHSPGKHSRYIQTSLIMIVRHWATGG